MSTQNSRSFPIRMPAELMEEIEAATQMTGLSQQDVMRLAMRIGLIDLRASKDIAGVLQEVATDKGQSFLAWARGREAGQQTPAATKNTLNQDSTPAMAAGSPDTTTPGPAPKPTAKIAKFPPPIMPESELKAAEPATEYKFIDRTKKA